MPSYNDNNAENIPKCDQTVTEGLGKNQVHVSENLDKSKTEEEYPVSVDGTPFTPSKQATECTSASNHKNESGSLEKLMKDIESCQSAISLLQKENKDLQEKLKELMDYSKALKKENEKLLSTAAARMKKIRHCKLNLKLLLLQLKSVKQKSSL